jgi:hypothetical protein
MPRIPATQKAEAEGLLSKIGLGKGFRLGVSLFSYLYTAKNTGAPYLKCLVPEVFQISDFLFDLRILAYTKIVILGGMEFIYASSAPYTQPEVILHTWGLVWNFLLVSMFRGLERLGFRIYHYQ